MKDLLKHLLEYYKRSDTIGICTTCVYCFHDTRTFDIVLNYIRANKPSITHHTEHYEHGRDNPLAFWWSHSPNVEKSKEPRIKYLEYLIDITPDEL